MAPVVTQIHFAHLVHGAVSMGQKLGGRFTDVLLKQY